MGRVCRGRNGSCMMAIIVCVYFLDELVCLVVCVRELVWLFIWVVC